MAITANEIKQTWDEFKAQGRTENDIIGAWYLMFKDGDITVQEFKTMLNVVGYDLSDEFMNMSEEEQKDEDKFFELDEDSDKDLSKEEIEEAKEYKKDEDEEEEGEEDSDDDEEGKEKDEEDEDEDEEDDEKKAARLFGFDKK